MLVREGVEALTTKQKERPRFRMDVSPLLSRGIEFSTFLVQENFSETLFIFLNQQLFFLFYRLTAWFDWQLEQKIFENKKQNLVKLEIGHINTDTTSALNFSPNKVGKISFVYK